MFPPQAEVEVEEEFREMARKAMLVRAEEVGEALVQIYRAERYGRDKASAYRETMRSWLDFLVRLEKKIDEKLKEAADDATL
jgi:hypothetical protein